MVWMPKRAGRRRKGGLGYFTHFNKDCPVAWRLASAVARSILAWLELKIAFGQERTRNAPNAAHPSRRSIH